MKQISALIGAIVISGIVGAAMVLVGMNVFFNKNSVPVSNSPASASTSLISAPAGTSQDSPTVQQLQNQIAQYQAQLNQAQQEIQQANTQLQQQNSQLQEYQSLIQALQQRGIITIGSDGTIYLRRGGF